jgi:hypothetical protein
MCLWRTLVDARHSRNDMNRGRGVARAGRKKTVEGRLKQREQGQAA